MSENIGQSKETPSETTAFAVTSTTAVGDTQHESQPEAAGITSNPSKHPNVSFSIWPPSERTREAVKNRLIDTLCTPSILSKRYGTMSTEEAAKAAKLIEEEAFQATGEATATPGDGIEILQVYSREISSRILDTMKAESGDAKLESDNENQPKEEECTAPPQGEKTEATVEDE